MYCASESNTSFHQQYIFYIPQLRDAPSNHWHYHGAWLLDRPGVGKNGNEVAEASFSMDSMDIIWGFIKFYESITPDRESQCIHPGHASFQWDAAHSGSQRSQCKIMHFTMERRWSGMISPNHFSKTWNIESQWGRRRHIYKKTPCLTSKIWTSPWYAC